MQCPKCNKRLVRALTDQGVFFACGECEGRAVSLSVVRKMAGRLTTRNLWAEAKQEEVAQGANCPICQRTMAEVSLPLGEQEVALDVCVGCRFVWFDPAELETLPEPAAETKEPEREETPRAQALREKIALAKAKAVAERAEAEGAERPFAGPEDTWKWIPALLRMPVETRVPTLNRIPWITWTLAIVLIGVYCATYKNLAHFVLEYGFIPNMAFRHNGLTFASSFFLHAGLFHLISNTYFLLVFGDNVEDYLGSVRYLLLLAGATLLGAMAHLLGDPRESIPCIGASGGISGVITFYALRFPKARLGILVGTIYMFRWFYMPACVALGLWILLQLVIVYMQLFGGGYVSGLAHLGGATVGVVAWLTWRRK